VDDDDAEKRDSKAYMLYRYLSMWVVRSWSDRGAAL
jgi:hypothetical protein